MTAVDFYFGPGSRYSYLASTQLDRIARETGAAFRWIPVFSGDLTARTGGAPRSPQDPAWRSADVARWARLYGVPFVDAGGEVDWRLFVAGAVAAELMGAAEPFAHALYARTYGEGRPPPDGVALAELAGEAGLDRGRFLMLVGSSAVQQAYAGNLEAALAAGAFAVPTFVTPDGEVFWGNDRLPLLADHLARPGAA